MRFCCGTVHNSESPSRIVSSSNLLDHFGPMLLKTTKSAVYLTSTQRQIDCPLLTHLRANRWNVHCSTALSAETIYQQQRPILILVDHRLPNLSTVIKALRCLPSSDDVLFAVLSDRVLAEKRRRSLPKSDLFYFVLSNSTDIGLFEFFARMINRIRSIPALLTALDETNQPIEICDKAHTIQYVNRAYESQACCSRLDIVGTTSNKLRRKSYQEPAPYTSKNDAVPRRRSSCDWHCIQIPTSSNDSRYVYIKKNSRVDVVNVSLPSAQSLSNLVGTYVTEMISSQNLHSSPVAAIAINDQQPTKYYGGLLGLQQQCRIRKRSLVDAFKDKRHTNVEGKRRISADVKNALQFDQQWSFDVFYLEKITDNHALSQLGIKIFERWKVHETLHCPDDQIARWFNMIEAHYHCQNPYHNATHAADVLQAISYFLDSPTVAENVEEMHATAILIAAAIHDLDHPGRGNAFLINTKQSLALIYNDQSVLENYHVALAFQLSLQPSNNANIFSRLSREEFVAMRQAIVSMVLATDMSKHFEYIKKFQQAVNTLQNNCEPQSSMSSITCKMMIKCADIANPAREWALCHKWAMRIVEEYFDQTKEEIEKSLPLTMALFDRDTCNLPLTQCGFTDMFARETFTIWCEFAQLPEILVQLENNYERWRKRTADWDVSKNYDLLIDA